MKEKGEYGGKEDAGIDVIQDRRKAYFEGETNGKWKIVLFLSVN